jgi:quercetin dioxygenase-like cupin family protein
MSRQSFLGCTALLLLAIQPSISHSQQPASAAPTFSSKQVHLSPLTGDDKKELVLISVSIAPGGAVPMHTHPGDCLGSVVEGVVELLVEGQSPRLVSAGEAYNNLRGTVHGFRNVGGGPARLLNNLAADKGVPRTQAVPAPAKP